MFSSFSDIITLIFLGFAFVYPFFLWITPLRTIDNGFYRFNLGMCCIVGAIGGTTFHFLNPDIVSEIYLWVWFGAIMFITAIYWNSNHINNIVITSIAIFGIIRYRTDPIPIKEMTYLFLVIGVSWSLCNDWSFYVICFRIA